MRRLILILFVVFSVSAFAQPAAQYHSILKTATPAPPPPFQSETIAYMKAVIDNGGTWDSTMYKAVDTLVRDLKGLTNPNYSTSNVWSKLGQVLPFCGGIAATHKFNLKDTASLQATFVGSPTHSVNGVSTNGSSQYINTNFNCSTQTYDNAMMALYYINESSSSGYVCGVYDGGVGIAGYRSEGTTLKSLNVLGLWKNLTTYGLGVVPLGKFVSIDYSATPRVDCYVNGTSAANSTPVSGALSGNYFIGALNQVGTPIIYFQMTARTWLVGNTLTSTEQSHLNSAITQFNTRLSRP